MKKIKYILSGIALALLTVMFMVFPNVYDYYRGMNNSRAKISTVNLEHNNSQELTPEQTLRVIVENTGNCIYRTTANEKEDKEYITDCKDIVNFVFGNESDSVITQAILEILDNYSSKSISTQKLTAIDNDNIVVLNIIDAQFDNLSISYEQSTKVMLYFSFYQSEYNSLDEIKSVYELEEDLKISKYYNYLGLNDDNFRFYVDYEPIFFIEAGIYAHIESESVI